MSTGKSSQPINQLMAFLQKAISPAVQKKYIENLTGKEKVVYEFDTPDAHYEIVDMIYSGRTARVLFNSHRQAAQSGIALDTKPELLFDYNQRFMELAASLKPKRVLLIGGGAYTLPKALLATYPKLRLTVVEPETTLEDIARRFFGWRPSRRVSVINTDGRTFLASTDERHDLILIDAFSYTAIPRTLLSTQAIRSYKQHLDTGGTVAMNVISPYYGRGADLIRQQHERYGNHFRHVDFFPASRQLLSPWLSQNYVLVARDSDRPELKLRFAAMPAPSR